VPRGVLQGEPDTLGAAPYDRHPGDLCLVLMRDPEAGDAVPAAMRWGLAMPSNPRRRVLQVPVERLQGRRMLRGARCLVPIEGYAQRGVRRTPITVRVAEGMGLAIAALWEEAWGGLCFAVVTTEANELLAPAHGRMPVLLPSSMWSSWIEGGALTPADVAIIGRPAPPAWIRAQAIRGAPARLPALSVARQLEDWAPGSRLWELHDRRRDAANSNLTEPSRAVG
jgi:putative SOS response-associated peptidase YedK